MDRKLHDRAECLNEIVPGKICGAHLEAGQTWCPVCGERTTTRRIGGSRDVLRYHRQRSEPRRHPRAG